MNEPPVAKELGLRHRFFKQNDLRALDRDQQSTHPVLRRRC